MGWRSILGLIAGVVVSFAAVFVAGLIGASVYPVETMVDAVPLGAILFLVAGYAVASFAGGLVSAWVGRNAVPAFGVGGVLLGAGLWNILPHPHALWTIAACAIALFVPAVLTGWLVARSRPRPEPPAQHELPLSH